MRKIIFMMSVSVDGFFEGPDGELGWQLVDEELHGHFNDWLGAAGAFLDGRVTYELMAQAWPSADADPMAPPRVAEFARIWRGPSARRGRPRRDLQGP
jgi:dihydrofolate reductase